MYVITSKVKRKKQQVIFSAQDINRCVVRGMHCLCRHSIIVHWGRRALISNASFNRGGKLRCRKAQRVKWVAEVQLLSELKWQSRSCLFCTFWLDVRAIWLWTVLHGSLCLSPFLYHPMWLPADVADSVKEDYFPRLPGVWLSLVP